MGGMDRIFLKEMNRHTHKFSDLDDLRSGFIAPSEIVFHYETVKLDRWTRAYKRDLRDGSYVLISNVHHGIDGSQYDSRWIVGRYSDTTGGYAQIAAGSYPLKLQDAVDAVDVLSRMDLYKRRTFHDKYEAEAALEEDIKRGFMSKGQLAPSPMQFAGNMLDEEWNERIENLRTMQAQMVNFARRSGMTAEWFCDWVERRREKGATFAMLSEELQDARRTVDFSHERVDALYRLCITMLNEIDPSWRQCALKSPSIPPKQPYGIALDPQPEIDITPVAPAVAPITRTFQDRIRTHKQRTKADLSLEGTSLENEGAAEPTLG